MFVSSFAYSPISGNFIQTVAGGGAGCQEGFSGVDLVFGIRLRDTDFSAIVCVKKGN